MSMKWNVIRFDFNKKNFVTYNILSKRFIEEINNETKDIKNKKDFSDRLKLICMSIFWKRTEWEIIIKEWCGGDNPKEMKVDVFDQLFLNWDRFVDYLWDNLKKEKEKE